MAGAAMNQPAARLLDGLYNSMRVPSGSVQKIRMVGSASGKAKTVRVSRSTAPPQASRWAAALSTSSTTKDRDRKSTRLNSSHVKISYAVFCLKKKKQIPRIPPEEHDRPA